MNDNPLKCVIIDDESNGRENLSGILKKYCPEIQVVAQASSVLSGIEAIQQYQPELIFLDIEMPDGNGFKLLEFFDKPTFGVIFVTAYDHYAIQAIRFSAIDYILKPINIIDLKNAIDRFLHRKKEQNQVMMKQLIQNSVNNLPVKKLALPSTEKIEYHELQTIIRCEGESNYTTFFFINGTKLMISKTLIEYEEILEPFGFVRTHKSHLVNLMHVTCYNKIDGGSLTLSNGTNIPVSRRRKDFILEKLQ